MSRVKCFICVFIVLFSIKTFANSENRSAFFDVAKPIWVKGKQKEMNLTVGFVTKFDVSDNNCVKIKVTGSSLYRLLVNGHYVGYGPARAAHGYYRVDEWDISDHIRKRKENVLSLEVVGYNINSFYLLDQPSFVQAEIIANGLTIAATGVNNKARKSSFNAILLNYRIQKVPKYSYQRTFVESYEMNPDYNSWTNGIYRDVEIVDCEITEPKELLARNVLYPEFNTINPTRVVSNGRVETNVKPHSYWRDRSLTNISAKLKGFTEHELDINPSQMVQEIRTIENNLLTNKRLKKQPVTLKNKEFSIFEFENNSTGFIGAELDVTEDAFIVLTFDEILTENDINFNRIRTLNAITYKLKKGKYSLESIEPYTLKFLKITLLEGECRIRDIFIREYVNPDTKNATFICSDKKINRIFQAGIETYRQNSVDLFMDCPSRERAGWLCDSYFMGKAEQYISGNTRVEKSFLENYVLPDSFSHIPKGMLPMCYPADHYSGEFIPNWNMWLVLELYDYLQRSNDSELIKKYKSKVLDMVDFFSVYENEFGLLEKLPGWIFVEWSDANKYVRDVNFPTNMLYASMLETCSKIYKLDSLETKATNIRNKIKELSFNGKYFVDNAIRDKEGKLVLTKNVSEACQYYAYYFNVASPEEYPDLWNKLFLAENSSHKKNETYNDIVPANILMGIPLRLLLLSRYEMSSQFVNESIDYLHYMVEMTGTLWEHTSTIASLNHGFMSFIVSEFYKNILGVRSIDVINKKITIKIPKTEITYCRGTIPIGDNLLQCKWKKSNGKIEYHYKAPDDYKVIVEKPKTDNVIVIKL